jgi:hypothetical protein
MEYRSLSESDIPELLAPTVFSFIANCCQQRSYWSNVSYWLSWSHHFESFTVSTKTKLTDTEYRCHKWPRICSVSGIIIQSFFSFMTYHRISNKSNTTDAIYAAGTTYTWVYSRFLMRFLSCWSVLSFLCMFLDNCLSFFFGH